MKNHQLAFVCLLAVLGSTGHAENFLSVGTEAVNTGQFAPAHSEYEIQQWIDYLQRIGQWPALEEEQQRLLDPSIIEQLRDSGEIEQETGSKVMSVCTDR